MPTPVVSVKVIPRKKTPGTKHRTHAERDSLFAAAEAFERTDAATLKVPSWLGKDARDIWNRKVAEIKGLNSPDALLDPLDSDVFATWCNNVVLYRKLASKNGSATAEDYKLMISLTMRINEGAEKLGFTPASRARLIRRRAVGEGNADNFGKDFD